MTKKKKKKDDEIEKRVEQLRKEVAEKGKEIAELKKTIEEMRTQIQEKEKTGKAAELDEVFDDVSQLVDVGFNIFGTSSKTKGGRSKGKGLFGLINDLAKLAEKSQTYHKRIKLGEKGVMDFRVRSGPIRRSAKKPTSHVKIHKPKGKTSSKPTPTPPKTVSIKEGEPIVDVFEEEDHLKVTAELPGIEEKDIKLEVKDNLLAVTADTSEKTYHKEVKLPTHVEKDSIKFKYRNGVLEVKLRKAEDAGEKEA